MEKIIHAGRLFSPDPADLSKKIPEQERRIVLIADNHIAAAVEKRAVP